MLYRLPVSIPPLPVQRRIAEVLGRLDDKIEVNRRINRHAGDDGAGALPALVRGVRAVWDGDFVESELGAMPKGWAICSVYDQAQFFNGASLLQFQPNEERRG